MSVSSLTPYVQEKKGYLLARYMPVSQDVLCDFPYILERFYTKGLSLGGKLIKLGIGICTCPFKICIWACTIGKRALMFLIESGVTATVTFVVFVLLPGLLLVYKFWKKTCKRTHLNQSIICMKTILGSGNFHGSDKAFFDQLRKTAIENGIELRHTAFQTKKECQKGDKVHFVNCLLCVNVTRVVSDINAAMELVGKKTDDPTILAVFHHMRQGYRDRLIPTKEAIPLDLASNFAHICDIRFFSDLGMYKCDDNTKALEETTEFLKNNSCNTQSLA